MQAAQPEDDLDDPQAAAGPGNRGGGPGGQGEAGGPDGDGVHALAAAERAAWADGGDDLVDDDEFLCAPSWLT